MVWCCVKGMLSLWKHLTECQIEKKLFLAEISFNSIFHVKDSASKHYPIFTSITTRKLERVSQRIMSISLKCLFKTLVFMLLVIYVFNFHAPRKGEKRKLFHPLKNLSQKPPSQKFFFQTFGAISIIGFVDWNVIDFLSLVSP